MTPELAALLSPEERAELDALLSDAPVWIPQTGPQTTAYLSQADIVGYGGAAGGGKTDLALGTALTQHTKIAVFRENGTEHTSSIDRLAEILDTRNGWNGSDRIWRLQEPHARRQGHQIEFCSIPNMGDENKYRGRPHDLLVFEEATGMFQEQIRFLSTWLRTTDKGQPCKIVMTFNPPTDAKGRWVIQYFAPWLDKNYPNPAKPGELRWFVNDGDKDIEVLDGEPVDVKGVMLTPQSRTFIPARVGDNKYMTPQYLATLHALPEPTRSLMLYGDFQAGLEDDPWQVIPTAWVENAMRRWVDISPKPEMMGVGVDVARGGRDSTVIARKHEGLWFDKPLTYQGESTNDGPKVAGLTIAAVRDDAPIAIDVIGIGASPYDFLMTHNQQVIGVNVSERSYATDRSGRLTFVNLRSEIWWKAREILDPTNDTGIALPPDDRLKADLCAPKWMPQGAQIRVESREDIVKRIGRSPDFASAYLLAMMDIPKASMRMFSRGSGAALFQKNRALNHDPFADLI